MSDNDVVHEFVRITGGGIRRSVDQFVKSTEGLRQWRAPAPTRWRHGRAQLLNKRADHGIEAVGVYLTDEPADGERGHQARRLSTIR
jgi:hypothetical protein